MGGLSVVTLAAAKHYAKDYTDAAVSALPKGLAYKGTVATVSDLPASGNELGDLYTVSADGSEHIWTQQGTSSPFWLNLSSDITFIVMVTKEQEGYESDATNAQIYAAYSANKIVLLHMAYENQWMMAISVTATKASFGVLQGDSALAYVNATLVEIENDVISAEVYSLVKTTDLVAYRTASAQNAIDATKQDVFQVSTMPTAAEAYSGRVYQYIGATDSTYTNGYFYKCNESGGGYVWVRADVQPSSGSASLPLSVVNGKLCITYEED